MIQGPYLIGAGRGTRTLTSCLTRPSNVRVYQFRHLRRSRPYYIKRDLVVNQGEIAGLVEM